MIFVESADGTVSEGFYVDLRHDTFEDLQDMISVKFDLEPEDQYLTHKEAGYAVFYSEDPDEFIGNMPTTLAHLHTLKLNTPSPTASPTQEHVRVYDAEGHEEIFYVDLREEPGIDLMARIADRFGIPEEDQVLTHDENDGALFEGDNRPLSDSGLRNGHTLRLNTRTPTSTPTELVIYVENTDGMVATYEVNLSEDTLRDVQEFAFDEFGVVPEDQLLTHKESSHAQLEGDIDAPLVSFDISGFDTIRLNTRSPTTRPTSPSVFVRYADEDDPFAQYVVDLDFDDIDSIKARIEESEGIPIGEQELQFPDGLELPDDTATLNESGVPNLGVLVLVRHIKLPCPTKQVIRTCPNWSWGNCIKRGKGKGKCTRCGTSKTGTCIPGTDAAACDVQGAYDHCYEYIYVRESDGTTHKFSVWLDTDTIGDVKQMLEDKLTRDVYPKEDMHITFNDVLLLTDLAILESEEIALGDVLVLLDRSYCLAEKYWAGSIWACDDSHDWGPAGWVEQNTKNARWDRCRGFDGANSDFKNANGDYICVEADRDAQGFAGGDICSGMMDFEAAKAHCASMKARLCTQEELQASCAERTGCDYDYTWIWSDTPCVPNAKFGNGLSGHIVSPGDMRKWKTRSAPSELPSTPGFGCQDDFINSDRGGCRAFEPKGAGGACAGLGVPGTVTETWIKPAGDRKLYLDAMRDLFQEFDAMELGCDPEADSAFGQCCLPDSGRTKVFVRCCADHRKQFCAQCPAGKTNEAGYGKELASCRCATGSLDENGGCSGPDTLSPSTQSPSMPPVTMYPTLRPSGSPTTFPSHNPTRLPTRFPSSVSPTSFPSNAPTAYPSSAEPTQFPSFPPTSFPSSPMPTTFPTNAPTKALVAVRYERWGSTKVFEVDIFSITLVELKGDIAATFGIAVEDQVLVAYAENDGGVREFVLTSEQDSLTLGELGIMHSTMLKLTRREKDTLSPSTSSPIATATPSLFPTTRSPSSYPTSSSPSTRSPTSYPSRTPYPTPTKFPSQELMSIEPTFTPSYSPTVESTAPSPSPSISENAPSESPTPQIPSESPTARITERPVALPTHVPSGGSLVTTAPVTAPTHHDFCPGRSYWVGLFASCVDCPDGTGNAPGLGKGPSSCVRGVSLKATLRVDDFDATTFSSTVASWFNDDVGGASEETVSLLSATLPSRRRRAQSKQPCSVGEGTEVAFAIETFSCAGSSVVSTEDSSQQTLVCDPNAPTLSKESAKAWYDFYDSANGGNWTVGGIETCCRTDPCSRTCDNPGSGVEVACAIGNDGALLTKVVLPNNNVVLDDGVALADIEQQQALKASGVITLELAGAKFTTSDDSEVFEGDEESGDSSEEVDNSNPESGSTALQSDNNDDEVKAAGTGTNIAEGGGGMSTGTLAGIIVGALVLLSILTAVFLVARRRKKEHLTGQYHDVINRARDSAHTSHSRGSKSSGHDAERHSVDPILEDQRDRDLNSENGAAADDRRGDESAKRKAWTGGEQDSVPLAAAVGAPPPPSGPVPPEAEARRRSLEARRSRALPAVPPGHSDAQDVEGGAVLPQRPQRLLSGAANTTSDRRLDFV